MTRASLFLLTTLLAASTAIANTKIIPVAGHLPGANGTTWTTDVSVTNNSATGGTVDLVFHPEDGIARTRTITVGAGQSVLLEDAVSPGSFAGANPASWLGQLEIRSSNDLSVSAHIFTAAPAGGTYGSTYEGFDPAVLSTSGSMTGLIASGRYRSNVAFANPNEQAATFDYVLRREDGSVAATRRADVPAHSTRQFAIGEDIRITAGDDDGRFLLTWTSNVPAYAIGSVIDNRSGDPTNAPSTAGGSTQLFFPVVGRTAGNLGTFWSTSIAISSTSDDAGSVTFVYVDSASKQTFTQTLALPPHGTIKLADLNASLGAPNGSGALTVTATTRIVGAARVFNTQADGSTYGSAVLPQENVVRASKVRISGVRRDSSYRLNVAISNDDGVPADGVVRLFDDRGVEVEVEPFHAEHGASVQVSMGRGEAEVRSGEVEVETEHGVSVTVLASNVDNRSGDTVMHESEQENERQHELEIRFNPTTAAAGTPVTFSIGTATNVSAVRWNFGDGTTGSGTTTTHTYASAGEYDVTVEVTLAGGAIVRDREDIHITGSGTTNPGGTVPGAIDFSWSPANPAPGQQVTFTASGTTGGCTFEWKFPGDVRKSGSVVTFTFPAAGSYEVEVELEHAGTTTPHAQHVVTVGGGTTTPGGGTTAPAVTSIDFTVSPATPKAGQAATFTATFDRQPPAGSSVKWRFLDSARPVGNPVSFTFPAPGKYRVRVELEHAGTTTVEREKDVTVQ